MLALSRRATNRSGCSLRLLPDHLARMGALLEGEGAAWGYSRPAWVTTDGVIVDEPAQQLALVAVVSGSTNNMFLG